MKLDCVDCLGAASGLWHGFTDSCSGCRARSVARSPEYRECRMLGRLTSDYVTLLARTGVEHQRAKDAWDSDAINRRMGSEGTDV